MSNVAVSQTYVDESTTFESFQLDPRLQQGLNKLGFENPTLIQTQSIKISLDERKDIIARASTGSGKTAAYCIPIIQRILSDSTAGSGSSDEEIQALVLVPTKELASQVTEFLNKLTIYCGKAIKSLNLNNNISDQIQSSLLMEKPSIVVSTPTKLIQLMSKNNNKVNLTKLKYLVIDEVDLVVSYGYEEDLDALSKFMNLKQDMQVFLMSATLNEDIKTIKETFCNKPVVLKLQDTDQDKNKQKLMQYYIKTNELDKFLLIYVILKLQLIKGKILIFVNDLDRGYKLKLFLLNFGIRSCLLNSELPINSRLHIVEEFNKNVYNLLIATDDSNEIDDEHDFEEQTDDRDDTKESNSADKETEEVSSKDQAKTKSKNGSSTKGRDYGVSRGVDFRNVACVLNFDLPTSSKSYVHRVGRTARGGKSGMSLSFVVKNTEWGKHKASSLKTAIKDEKILKRIEKQQGKLGYELKPYQFDESQLNNFRYRMEDSFRSITRAAVREARLKEIKMELITSERLKRHFEENPQDLQTLRHDNNKASGKIRADVNLKRVPDYLLPEGVRPDAKKVGFVPFNNPHKKGGKVKKGGKKKKVDPLKKFKK